MKTFLNALFSTIPESSFIELRCIPVNAGSGEKPVQYYFSKAELDSLESMAKALDSRGIYHVCIGVLPRNSRNSGTTSNINTLQTLWIDIDAKNKSLKELYNDIATFPIQPSIIVSSGHGYHCYWLLQEPLTLAAAEIKEIESRLHHITRADKTFDAARVLRLPGTMNCKNPQDIRPCKVMKINKQRYNLETILSWIQAVEKEQQLKEDAKIDEIALKRRPSEEAADAEAIYDFTTWTELKRVLPQFVVRRIMELPLHLRDEHGEKLDRSKNDFYVATSLLELGFTPAQVKLAFKIFADNDFAAGTKYKEKGSAYLDDYTLPAAKQKVPLNIHTLLNKMEQCDEDDEGLILEYAAAALKIVANTRADAFANRIGAIVTSRTYMSKPDFLIYAQNIISGQGAYEFETFEMSKKPKIMYKKVAEMIVKDNPYIRIGTEVYRYDNGVFLPDLNGQKLIAHIWAITENRPVGSTIGMEFNDLSDRTWLDLKQKDVSEISNYVMQNALPFDPAAPLVEPNLICVKNGMVDWEKGLLKPHSPSYFRLSQLDVTYDPKITSPVLDKFMGETFYGEDLNTIWEYMGVSILESITAKKFIIFVGSGDNGKSVWLNTVRKVLGADNISSASLSDLANNRFAKAQLLGKLANIASDISGSALDDISNIKELTGNDQTSADRKFQSQVNFVNKASLLFSCNILPEATQADEAYFKRLLIVECPNQVPEEKQDKLLETKLTTEAAKAAWLNKAIEGLKRFFRNKQVFSHSSKIEALVESHKNECRPDLLFIEKYIMEEPDSILTLDVIMKEIKSYVSTTGGNATPTKSVVKAMMAKAYPQYPLKVREMGMPAYSGLKINKKLIDQDFHSAEFEIHIKGQK